MAQGEFTKAEAQRTIEAVEEIMGHVTMAGRVTEQAIGGQSFIRIDVPEIGNQQAFTRFYGSGAIYSITPVDEETGRLAGLGFGAALLIIDRQHQAEQRRFTANARENLAFLEQQARVQGLLLQNQGRASQSLLRQNEQLTRLIPSGGDGLDVDALSWDIREDSESEGRW